METKSYYKKTRAPNQEIRAPRGNTRTPTNMLNASKKTRTPRPEMEFLN
jgi:hypothetical protein